MIIDSHSHWLPEEIIRNAHFFSQAWGDIEGQLKIMDSSGIDQAVITYPTSDAHLKLDGLNEVTRIYNDNLAKVIRRYPSRFIGAGILPIGNAEEMLAEAKRCREELGFPAISLATSYDGLYLDDAIFLPLYKHAAKSSLPIFVHSQIVNPIGYERVQDPLLTPVIEYVFDTTISIGKLLMSGILEEYREVKFIFAYFGGVTAFLRHRFDATYRMLRSINFVKDLKADPTDYLKRIYVDTSGDKIKANLISALDLFGPGHILWGSDWPAKKDLTGSLEIIRDSALSAEEKDNILSGNLKSILGG